MADNSAAPGVELTDQVQEPRGGGAQVHGELGDLVTETVGVRERLNGARLD